MNGKAIAYSEVGAASMAALEAATGVNSPHVPRSLFGHDGCVWRLKLGAEVFSSHVSRRRAWMCW